MEFKDIKLSINTFIKNIGNAYDISKADVRHIIAVVFEIATYYKLLPIFNENDELIFAEKITGKIYDIPEARRYINMTVARRLFSVAIADSSVLTMMIRYKQYEHKNIIGTVLGKEKNNGYIVSMHLNQNDMIGILPFKQSDRRFEFDYGTEYEFFIHNITSDYKKHTFSIILSRTARGFAANIISRILKTDCAWVYDRTAGRVSYVDVTKPDDVSVIDEIKSTLQETVVFKPTSKYKIRSLKNVKR